ncbi:uroporphyrinogen-III C-methyltransferase [Budviciaceae bacterium CWB-B4]|uniref:Uroporphyrinogen-III C-methyltransferase n=1 Tax=Limnobaculum xujianqingii TaxID=2738837 RepID=A0A9D7ALQ5_9GAMM|nr:uroporphyrinogen-III C-methyltransferase [Limnobaculum xujianqingii]MBK5074908.1 uroporphyrinogen-III C-methyltransferase [Limnobaculum xujianqingii]MBK5178216.1 uroporphyrinogen-III C-methyltransferase [Limnobaculum xujianqingii]
MTDSTTPSAPVEQENVSAEKETNTQTPKVRQGSRSGVALGAIAIALVIALGGGLYYHGHQWAASQQATIQQLQAQIDSLKTGQSKEDGQLLASQNEFTQQLKNTEKQIAEQNNKLDAQVSTLQELQNKVTTIASSDSKIWHLSEADFLVKMAARKLWIEQDAATAINMLKSADKSLSEFNDPSLSEVRQAIIQDINSISAVSQIDFDGIALRLNELSDQVMNLPSASTDWDNAPLDKSSTEVSGELKDWRQNLKNSWHSFMSEFITIRSRDVPANELTSPLLTPDQDTYLRENLRLKLLIAARAVSRHQSEIYQQSLDSVSTWVRAYFDPDHSSTKAFISQLDELSQQSINLDMPKELKSLSLLDTVTRKRTRDIAPPAPVSAPAQAPITAPAPDAPRPSSNQEG